MTYLYHRVPPNMQGDTLYPLNILKEKYPEAYDKAVQKYVGREHIINQVIPGVGWLWNDVLHFTAVHPRRVKEAMAEAGFTDLQEWRHYQIDPHLLEPEKTIVYLYAHQDRRDMLNETNFVAYDPDELEAYSHIPNETKVYFRESFLANKRPLLYHRVPHILYHGTLNVSGLEIVTV